VSELPFLFESSFEPTTYDWNEFTSCHHSFSCLLMPPAFWRGRHVSTCVADHCCRVSCCCTPLRVIYHPLFFSQRCPPCLAHARPLYVVAILVDDFLRSLYPFFLIVSRAVVHGARPTWRLHRMWRGTCDRPGLYQQPLVS